MAFALAHPVLAETFRGAAVDFEAYLKSVHGAGDDPSQLKGTHGVVLPGGDLVPLETGWTHWKASPASRETLKALESRVEVARHARPTAFQPKEIRRRLSSLLDRLYPSRVRALGAAADDPVRADPIFWTTGGTVDGGVHVVCRGRGKCVGCNVCVRGSGTYTGSTGGSSYGGSSQGSSSGAVTYSGGSSGGVSYGGSSGRGGGGGSSGGSRGSTRPQPRQRSYSTTQTTQPVRTYSNTTTTTQPTYSQTRQTQVPVQRNRPVEPVTRPSTVVASRPTEVSMVPPPKPPAVLPPSPPPQPVVKPENKATSWLTVVLWVLICALPLAAYMYWRSRRKPAAPPPVQAPKSVSDLIDPEHVGLGAAELGKIGRASAVDEDWMRAMRYLFAAMLTYLAEQRRAPIRDWHTNKEIANLVGRDAKLAENFWSAATIFELFWFGQRRPMENDFRLFETMARDCMTRLEVGA